MPHRTHRTRLAVARRDSSLSRTRKLTLSILGSAAAATLGLGTAFAHALPGHSSASGSTGRAGSSASSGTGGTQGTAGTRSGSGSTGSGSATGSRGAAHGQAATSNHGGLARPKTNPVAAKAPTTSQPVVSSGGS
jgi:hypothetical protein